MKQKQKDDILLEQAYENIAAKTLEEKYGVKSAIAGAAAMGLTALGAHAAGPSASGKSSIEHTSETTNPHAALEAAIEKIHAKESIPNSLLKLIVTDKDLSYRLAYVLALKQQPLPSLLKSVVGNYDKELQSNVVGP